LLLLSAGLNAPEHQEKYVTAWYTMKRTFTSDMASTFVAANQTQPEHQAHVHLRHGLNSLLLAAEDHHQSMKRTSTSDVASTFVAANQSQPEHEAHVHLKHDHNSLLLAAEDHHQSMKRTSTSEMASDFRSSWLKRRSSLQHRSSFKASAAGQDFNRAPRSVHFKELGNRRIRGGWRLRARALSMQVHCLRCCLSH